MTFDSVRAMDVTAKEPDEASEANAVVPVRTVLAMAHLKNFRNLRETLVEPSEGLNVLEGSNGHGKTNFLEAICMLAGLRSFRGARLGDMVGPDAQSFELAGRVSGERDDRVIEITGFARGRRVRLEDQPVRRTSDLLEVFPVVFFGPDDLALTKAGPSNRRRLLDEGVVLCDPRRAVELRRYQEVVRERNQLLRQGAEGGADMRLLRVYTRTLREAGAQVSEARARFLADFLPVFADTAHKLCDGELEVGLELLESCFDDSEDAMERRDLAAAMTTRGPHRDDLKVLLDGHDARIWASQGQHRLLVIALKIALLELATRRRGAVPLLLLDDVSSELDPQRSEILSAYLRGRLGQVFATTTNAASVGLATNPGLDSREAKRFEVRDGEIKACEA
jgi:DNA replication and repair protein RecF